MDTDGYLDLEFFEQDHQNSAIYFQNDYPNLTFSQSDLVTSRPSIFGDNKQDENCNIQAKNTANDCNNSSKARGRKEDIYYEDMEDDYLDEQQEPSFPAASASYKNREIQEKDSTQAHSSDPPSPQPLKKKKSKYVKKRSQPAQKKNEYKSKNLLPFLWTKTVNYLDETKMMAAFDWWQSLKEKTGSRNQFNELFQKADRGLLAIMEEMFSDGYFFKMVMLSAINAERKKIYIKYIPKLERCFQNKFVPWIN